MSQLNYWQRLDKLKLHSIERRTERFIIFYTWKSLMNMVPSLEFILWTHPRKGKLIRYKKNNAKSSHMRSMKDISIYGQGPKLFNALPQCIREWEGTFSTFKFMVDNFISLLPDRPCIQGYCTDNNDLYGGMTNSVIHWIRNLNLHDWKPIQDPDPIQEYEDN